MDKKKLELFAPTRIKRYSRLSVSCGAKSKFGAPLFRGSRWLICRGPISALPPIPHVLFYGPPRRWPEKHSSLKSSNLDNFNKPSTIIGKLSTNNREKRALFGESFKQSIWYSSSFMYYLAMYSRIGYKFFL